MADQQGKRKRSRPGLRKSRASSKEDDGAVEDVCLASLEKVQSLQAVRKKTKGITPKDSALGQGKPLEEKAEEKTTEVEEDASKYGLQAFATEDRGAKKESNEEERMKKYVEERISSRTAAVPEKREEDDASDRLAAANAEHRAKLTYEDTNWSGGIAEVPVPLETKLKNIEEIEKAKQRIIDEAVGLQRYDDGSMGAVRRADLPTSFGKVEQKRRKAHEF